MATVTACLYADPIDPQDHTRVYCGIQHKWRHCDGGCGNCVLTEKEVDTA